MILLCQRSPHIIDIQLHVLNSVEQFGLLLTRLGLLAVSFTAFCLRLAFIYCKTNRPFSKMAAENSNELKLAKISAALE